MQSLRSRLALMSPLSLDSKVVFADNQSVICPAVCTKYSHCHSHLTSCLSVLRTMILSLRCRCLDRGCTQDNLFRSLGRRETLLVISKSCSVHFLRSKTPTFMNDVRSTSMRRHVSAGERDSHSKSRGGKKLN